MVILENASIDEKLKILADSAKYDVACTSSGVERKAEKGSIGSTCASGICHSFAADGRCISLLKVLYTNECIYNCRYCINRADNDVPRVSFTPEELCTLTMEFYKRNYIEGLFLSSGILRSPDYTMELIIESLRMLREDYHFGGYIHCKAIPGTSSELVELAGWYADRMSINLELPTADGLKRLAPNKTRARILQPMRQIQLGMNESQRLLGMKGGNKSAYWYTQKRLGNNQNMLHTKNTSLDAAASDTTKTDIAAPDTASGSSLATLKYHPGQLVKRGFVPAGQSTQMIIGASGETDLEIISVTEALYQKFDLKRVFYSAFINVNQDSTLPALSDGPPLAREHRLYQADWLLRYYGFCANDILSRERPNFNPFLDPKCDWALRHLEKFPVEINKADYDTLLKVPGIGTKSAGRIVKARRMGTLDFNDLKHIGVVLKRAVYFITCKGKMFQQNIRINEDWITKRLLSNDIRLRENVSDNNITYSQMHLFDFAPQGGSK